MLALQAVGLVELNRRHTQQDNLPVSFNLFTLIVSYHNNVREGVERIYTHQKEVQSMKHHRYLFLFMVLAAVMSLQACGKSSSSSSAGPTGSMAVSVTDAPGDFDHVWITVKDIWIHTSDAAGPNEAGWLKYPLSSYKTVDLLTLANGNAQSIWDSITLPVGDYRQIRLVLADTDDSLTASATTAGLKYNNEVVANSVEYPLHIPDARHGIRLVPVVGVFTVVEGGTLRLAIDFDAGHDIVDFRTGEYILKPRLAYFDLDHAGAIVGKLALASAGSITTPRFVIKAERLNSDGTNTYHMVRRWTIPRPDGSFILYPISTLVTSTWDVVIRGLDYQTVIIKGVPVTNGATPASSATDLGTITMTAATSSDYPVDGTITSPTGAWVQFYQTLPGTDEYPYEIRFRHFNPLLGRFLGFELSSDLIQVGTYSTGTITLTSTTPVGGKGAFNAVADAILYTRSTPTLVTSGTTTIAFGTLPVVNGWQENSISGSISSSMTFTNGALFAVHGGMIVNAMSTVMGTMPVISDGMTYTLSNLPGGSLSTPHPLAIYGVEAIGWSLTKKSIAIPALADLSTGDASGIDMNMILLP